MHACVLVQCVVVRNILLLVVFIRKFVRGCLLCVTSALRSEPLTFIAQHRACRHILEHYQSADAQPSSS